MTRYSHSSRAAGAALGAGILFFAFAARNGSAETIVWNGSANDGDWGNANNWDGFALPSAADTAALSAAGAPVIRLGADRVVDSIALANSGDLTLFGDGTDGLALGGAESIQAYGAHSANRNYFIAAPLALAGDTTWTLPQNRLNICGPVSGAANLTVAGAISGRTLILSGDFATDGDILFGGNSILVGGEYTDGNGVVRRGGTLSGGRAVELPGSTTFAFTPQFIIENTYEARDNRLGENLSVVFGDRSGNLELRGNDSAPVTETIERVELGFGYFNISAKAKNTSNAADLVISNLVANPGAFGKVTVENDGKVIFPNGDLAKAVWPAQFFSGESHAKLAADYTITAASYVSLAASGNQPDTPASVNNGTVSLAEDTEIAALKLENSATLNLGTNDLLLSTAGIVFQGWGGQKTIASTGGKLIFGANDIIISQGSDAGMISAPIAWRRPAGNTAAGPSIIIPLAWNRISFTGEDFIGTYNGLYVESATSGFVFGGPSDRTFDGPIVGTMTMQKNGPGALRFNGPRLKYDQNNKINVNEGRLVLSHSSDWRGIHVASNGVVEVADNASVMLAATYAAGSTIGGIGTFRITDGSYKYNMGAGSWIAPGATGQIGRLTMTIGDWHNPSFSNGGGIKIKIDGADSDSIRMTGWYDNNLPDSGVLRLEVNALAKDSMARKNLEYAFISWAGYDPKNRDTFSWQITTSTPRTLDVSEATVRYVSATKSFVLSGVKNANTTTLLLIR